MSSPVGSPPRKHSGDNSSLAGSPAVSQIQPLRSSQLSVSNSSPQTREYVLLSRFVLGLGNVSMAMILSNLIISGLSEWKKIQLPVVDMVVFVGIVSVTHNVWSRVSELLFVWKEDQQWRKVAMVLTNTAAVAIAAAYALKLKISLRQGFLLWGVTYGLPYNVVNRFLQPAKET